MLLAGKFLKWVEKIEVSKVSLPHGVLAFLAILFLRNFFEGIVENARTIGSHPLPMRSVEILFFHFPLFYTSLFLSFLLSLYFLTRERMERISKVLLLFFPILLLPPFVDFILGGGFKLSYLFHFNIPSQIFKGFFSLHEVGGTSPGMRLEILLGSLLFSFYVYLKRRSVLWGVFGFVGFFLILYLHGILSSLFAHLSSLFPFHEPDSPSILFKSGGIISSDSRKLGLLFLLSTTLLLILSLKLFDRRLLPQWGGEIRPTSIIFLIMCMALGFFIGYSLLSPTYSTLFHNPFDLLALLTLLLSVFFAQLAKHELPIILLSIFYAFSVNNFLPFLVLIFFSFQLLVKWLNRKTILLIRGLLAFGIGFAVFPGFSLLELNEVGFNTTGLGYFLTGEGYYGRDEFEKAILEYEKALSNGYDHLTLYGHLARSYQKRGEHEKALLFYDLVNKKDPTHAFAKSGMGEIYYKRGELDIALRYFEEAVRLSPRDPKLRNNLGVIYRDLGDPVKAKEEFRNALLLDPYLEEAKRNLMDLNP